jgi:hypothetical protein
MKTLIHEREPFGGCSRTNADREDHTPASGAESPANRMLRMATRLG